MKVWCLIIYTHILIYSSSAVSVSRLLFWYLFLYRFYEPLNCLLCDGCLVWKWIFFEHFEIITKQIKLRNHFESWFDLSSYTRIGIYKTKTFLYSKSWHTKSSWFVLLFAIIDVILKCQVSCWKTGFTLVLHVELELYLGKKNRGIEFFWLFNIFFRIRLYTNPNTQSIAPLIRR